MEEPTDVCIGTSISEVLGRYENRLLTPVTPEAVDSETPEVSPTESIYGIDDGEIKLPIKKSGIALRTLDPNASLCRCEVHGTQPVRYPPWAFRLLNKDDVVETPTIVNDMERVAAESIYKLIAEESITLNGTVLRDCDSHELVHYWQESVSQLIASMNVASLPDAAHASAGNVGRSNMVRYGSDRKRKRPSGVDETPPPEWVCACSVETATIVDEPSESPQTPTICVVCKCLILPNEIMEMIDALDFCTLENSETLIDELGKFSSSGASMVEKSAVLGLRRAYVFSKEFGWWYSIWLEHIQHFAAAGCVMSQRFGRQFSRISYLFALEDIVRGIKATSLGAADLRLVVGSLGETIGIPKVVVDEILNVELPPIIYRLDQAFRASSLHSAMGLGFSSRDAGGRDEETRGLLQFEGVYNDGRPASLLKLTILKNIFARQLPKMPREYISRLVFDPKHRGFFMQKGAIVAGGVCYRPFYERGFAEIAFLAITSTEQVKGYGTRLMNHLKEHVKEEGIHTFLTYADNFATGYFRKQGFTSVLSRPRSDFDGYIKDYDVATLMQCSLNSNLNYLDISNILTRQKKSIVYAWKIQSYMISKLNELQNEGEGVADRNALAEIARGVLDESSDIFKEFVLWNPTPKLKGFAEKDRLTARDKQTMQETLKSEFEAAANEYKPTDTEDIDANVAVGEVKTEAHNPFMAAKGEEPECFTIASSLVKLGEDAQGDIITYEGLRNCGWTPWVEHLNTMTQMYGENSARLLSGITAEPGSLLDACVSVLTNLQKHSSAWPFLKAVTASEAPDYHNVITQPMDFETISGRIRDKKYSDVEEFCKDITLVFTNCRRYNDPDTPYVKCANTLEGVVSNRLKALRAKYGGGEV